MIVRRHTAVVGIVVAHTVVVGTAVVVCTGRAVGQTVAAVVAHRTVVVDPGYNS